MIFPTLATSESKEEIKAMADLQVDEGDSHELSGCKQTPAMSRKDSVGDLLLNLPRIASLPHFSFNISEDGENKAR